MKCPRCGSEMADEYRTSYGYRYPVGHCYKCEVVLATDDDVTVKGETRVRCFSEDCANFRKGDRIYGGECELSRIAISSGQSVCLSRVPRPEVEKP